MHYTFLEYCLFGIFYTAFSEHHNNRVNHKPCVPSSGHTALVIGQDYYSILNYTSAVGFPPFGVMSYTALSSPTGSLTGLKKPIDYGSGIEWTQGLADMYPDAIIQIGLYLVDCEDDVINGKLDDKIESLAKYLSSLDTAIYLRIGYEFDSSSNHYKPESYINMFRYIVTKFRLLKVKNTAFVWHASGFQPRDSMPLLFWYPGDEYVDWCGISLFQQPYDCSTEFLCTFPYVDDLISLCKGKNIPIMIAESTPFGGIIDINFNNNNNNNEKDGKFVNKAGYWGNSWNRWFSVVMDYINKHDIRMWSYINSDWDSMPMWKKEHAPGIYWGDSRVEKYPGTFQKWRIEVLYDKRYRWYLDNTERDRVCVDMNTSNSTNSNTLPWSSVLECLLISCLLTGFFWYVFYRLQRQPKTSQQYTIIN